MTTNQKNPPLPFWEASDYSKAEYEGEPLTEELLASVETELGYKLPAAYVELLKSQNGGIPRLRCFRTNQPTSWADDHIAISGIYGINRSKPGSLCGDYKTQFWIDEWGYPDIGVYFSDCPAAGHDMVCLDYTLCGPRGEPRVVHVDQSLDYLVTVLANSFQAFISGLVSDKEFATG